MDRTITAQDFINHCRAGLVLTGISEDGYEWEGERRNWLVLGWLEDGAYESLSDKGEAIISQFLA